MAVTIKHTRKVVVIGWDKNTVQGDQASLHAEGQEKRNTNNDGEANLYFPMDFKGEVNVTVRGSASGEDSGTISVK